MIRHLALVLVLGLAVAAPAYAEPTTEPVYGEGEVYEADVEGRQVQYTTHQQQGDELVLSSGAVVTSDAFLIFGAQPANRTFEPGNYRVVLTLTRDNTGDVLVAYARIELGGGTPVRWEPATSFGAESGTAVFIDQDAVSHASANYDPYGTAVLGALTDAVEHNEYWTSIVVDPDTGADAVIFTTGHGEGGYTTYWGFDKNNQPVALVADFNVLSP